MAQDILYTVKETRMPPTRLRVARSSEAPPGFKTETLPPCGPPKDLVMAGWRQKEGDSEEEAGSPKRSWSRTRESRLSVKQPGEEQAPRTHNYLFRPEEEHKLLSSLSKHRNTLYPTQKQGSRRLMGYG